MSKKLELTVDTNTFIEWIYADLGTSGLREIAYDVINTLASGTTFLLTPQGVFDTCGYIPLSKLNEYDQGDEEFNLFLEGEFKDDEINDPSTPTELSDGRLLTIKLI